MDKLLNELEEARDFFIAELVNEYDSEVLQRKIGQLYQTSAVIEKIKELKGEEE